MNLASGNSAARTDCSHLGGLQLGRNSVTASAVGKIVKRGWWWEAVRLNHDEQLKDCLDCQLDK